MLMPFTNAEPGRYYWDDIHEPDNDDEEPGCPVCGVAVGKGKIYCGASCEQVDEEGDSSGT
jgi:hypothetical protein